MIRFGTIGTGAITERFISGAVETGDLQLTAIYSRDLEKAKKSLKDYKLEVIPFNDKTNSKKGVFSTRTPIHPNKIGLSLVKLESVKDNIIEIRGVDILNETPLIDIKPYIPNFDFVEGEIKSGWMNSSLDEVKNKKSDKRFL